MTGEDATNTIKLLLQKDQLAMFSFVSNYQLYGTKQGQGAIGRA